VSSITQTKAEAQKLIKLYNQLQAEAKTADTEEAARKAAQAEKLVSQINTLQSALSKTKDRAVQAKQTPATKKKAATTSAASTFHSTKRAESADEKRTRLEERIGRIEDAQKRTRVQIEQLNLAKADLSRLQMEAEKNAVALEHRANEGRQPQVQELAKLNEQIIKKDAQYQSIKKELDTVRQQAQKDTDLLKEQRDAAVERQQQLEKDKMNLLRYGEGSSGFLNGLLVSAGLGVLGIVALAVVIFKTPWLDEVVCSLKDSPAACSFSPQPTVTTNNVTATPRAPVQEKPQVEQ
jgi:chromosome segregation ATPase